MKGYTVDCGYMGYLDGRYFLFADESDYREAYWENLQGQIKFAMSMRH